MHYATMNRDPLSHLSELPYFDLAVERPGLGQWGMLAAGALQAYTASQQEGEADTDQSAGMPGSRSSNKSVPRQPSALSTVSTAVVTQVSPQISPVMTQTQSSPGATVDANPTQFMPGGLSAEQAITPYGSAGMPGFPTNTAGISPYQPYTMDPMTGGYVPINPATGQPIRTGFLDVREQAPAVTAPVTIGPARMTDVPWIPIAIVGGVLAVAMLWPRRRRKT